jgi:2-dehydro-3-deoxyphosphooctonate aldolase (KDO 8-P synthase)
VRPQFQTGNVTWGGAEPVFILGPCVIESEEFVWRMARAIHGICREVGAQFIFKASYDKANRTSVKSARGPGLRDGCGMLAAIDLLQIPAFLCRQTDLIQAAAETGRAVNVKKGQFLAPWDVKNIAVKLKAFGCERFMFTERGTTFGYNNLVADMRSLYWMRELGCLAVFDATHSVQRPGGGGDTTSGDGVLAPVLARAAVAAGCDGVFIETHEDPSRALSDGPNQIPLAQLPALLKTLLQIHALVR